MLNLKKEIVDCQTAIATKKELSFTQRRVLGTLSTISNNDELEKERLDKVLVIIDIEKTGHFEMPNIRSSHDMALWLLIMKRGFSAYGLDENLAKYRVVSSSNTANKTKAAKEVWDVYRKVEKLNIIYSAYNFFGYVFNAIKKRI